MSAKKAVRRGLRRAPKKAAKKNAASRRAAPASRERRNQDPETLRLRSMNPLYTVADLQRSIRFYTDVLGFIRDQEYKGSDGKVQGVMLKAGACQVGLSQDDWAKGRDRQRGAAVRIWCTTVQDIDAIAARIKSRGHTLTQEPKAESWGGRSIALDDPDGFHISIHQTKS